MLYAIAVISQGKEVAGFRILDTEAIKSGKCVKDIPVASVASAIASGTKIENLGVKDGKVVGTNGVLDRYAHISLNNEPLSKPAVVVLFRTDDGFILADCQGNVTKATADEALGYSQTLTIANAKIVERDGKKIISSISGEYPYIEGPKSKVTTKFIVISDSDSNEEIFNKIKEHLNHKEKKILGKVADNRSDDVIKFVVNKSGLTNYVAKRDNEGAANAIKAVVGSYMPVLSKICSKKAVVENTKGLKAVYASVTDGSDNLIDRVVNKIESDKVNMGKL